METFVGVPRERSEPAFGVGVTGMTMTPRGDQRDH